MGKGVKITLVIVLVLGGVFAVLRLVKTDFKVTRTKEVNVPASHLYKIVADHKTRMDWSPWEKIDPEMKNTYVGTPGSVGASVSWESTNEDVGYGTLTTTEVKENEYLKANLIFTKPFEANNTIEWKFSETDGKTTAEWSCSGQMSIMATMFVNMEEMLGSKFEEGLTNLKGMSEKSYSVPAPEPEPAMNDSTNMEDAIPADDVNGGTGNVDEAS